MTTRIPRRRCCTWCTTAARTHNDAGPGSPSKGTAGARGLSGQIDHLCQADCSGAKFSMQSPHIMLRRSKVFGETRMTAGGSHWQTALT